MAIRLLPVGKSRSQIAALHHPLLAILGRIQRVLTERRLPELGDDTPPIGYEQNVPMLNVAQVGRKPVLESANVHRSDAHRSNVAS